jgi:signal transduction histidine kinase
MIYDTQSIRILLVEDDSGDLEISRRRLAEAGSHFSVSVARTLAEATGLIAAETFDAALIDLGLPDSNGLMALQNIHSASPKLPIVVLTALADEQLGAVAVEQGAQDYLVKGVSAESLRRSIHYAVQRQQSMSEKESLLARLQSANEMLGEKNLRLQTLFEAAQQFVDNLSHEFRTPLTVIREFATIMHDGLAGPVTPHQQEYTDIITDRVDDLAIMVDDMLDASRLEAGMLGAWRRECQTSAIISHVVRMLERKAQLKGIELATDIPLGLPPIYCDFDKSVRVVVNLAVNAIKFSPKASTVRIWARNEPERGEVTLGVTDTGPGISPEGLSRIFARFEQLDKVGIENHKGFGLGLAIARELAELNLGRLEVTSEVGQGSTFYCTIPVAMPVRLIGRFLGNIKQTDGRPQAIATIAVRASQFNELGASPVIDEFLQHTMRGANLVLHASAENWLIVALCQPEAVPELMARIDGAWTLYGRNCPLEGLPDLNFQLLHSYPLGNDMERTVDSVAGDFQSLAIAIQSNPRVLVVDDDPQIVAGLSVRLQSAGYEVTSASNGRDGVNDAIRSTPDAVILDMRMPGLDGLSTLALLTQHPQTANTPVIMLSASLRDRQRALDLGARFFLDKPCESEKMFAALNAVMPACMASRRKRKPALATT